ncbi:hypothetical protein [Bizionia arctica]|uniref:Uncharacterized protein n=1 Tax=Bizionia arctica TaxID=1495645 RepID=A0A917LL51_9FLAO|nr:hypothetical protein [Bizionia arctica]GGG40719.1 hypothetical protein GCM10010976_10410 [Bizionia arctica]
MKIFKFFQYAYLFFAVIFIYDAVDEYMETGVIAYTSLLLAAAAVFMFFFRKRFNKKFENKGDN